MALSVKEIEELDRMPLVGVASDAQLAQIEQDERINHPDHYGGDTTYEAIKVIEAWGLGFSLGNCVKYIRRAGHKQSSDTIEDLKKARWYLDRHITNLEKSS